MQIYHKAKATRLHVFHINLSVADNAAPDIFAHCHIISS